MLITVLLLLGSAFVIYLACEYFVNGVEWVGQQFGVSKNATGTVLAAFGTALPESVVTFVAVVFGHTAAQKEIGVGAALGGPLVLGTVAYAVVGFTFLFSKRQPQGHFLSDLTGGRLISDQKWFLSIFVFKAALGLVAFAIKPWLGILFLFAYAAYVRQEMTAGGDAGNAFDLEPLKIRPKAAAPARGWPLLQTGGALVVIFLSSQVFVHQIDAIGPWLGLSPQLVALLLSPIATELPEILNAVIWVRQGKQTLALANISGAMMIQATIPSALGIMFTPWMLQHALVWAAVVTMLSIVGLYFFLKKNALTPRVMALFGGFYVLFAVGLYFIPLQA
ncbi:MAG: putative sodium/calcium exchanger protein [Herbaspirillum sp.]|jgi:cation:H+ antiporter|nr:putative sodium/calcium exchanger protein [Herbaspirillum sp.]